jgi:hypothetical protein
MSFQLEKHKIPVLNAKEVHQMLAIADKRTLCKSMLACGLFHSK